MRIGSHEYANEADDDDDVPKPAQSLGTPVPRQKVSFVNHLSNISFTLMTCIKGYFKDAQLLLF